MILFMKVPTLRFPQFSGEWEEKKLGEIIELMQSGVSRLLNDSDIGLPVIRSNNLIEGQLDVSDLKYWYKIDNQGANLENYFLKDGDLLVNFINSPAQIGKVALYENKLKRNTIFTTNIMRLSFNKAINYKFVFYFFHTSSYINYIQSITKPAVNQASFTTKEFKMLSFSFPSLQEQEKIAGFLSKIDDKIQQLTQKQKLLESYKKGVMQQLFSQQLRFKDDNGQDFPDWEEKTLGDVCNIGTGQSNREDSSLIGLYTFFDRSQDIRMSDIYLFDCEAIIIAGEGQDFIPKYFIGKFDLHQRTYAITNFNGQIGKYLFYFIHYFRGYFLSQAVGSTVKSLRLPMFKKMPVYLPHIKEQTKIANFLTAIDAKINLVEQQLALTKEYKKGLLQQMFV